LTTRTFAAELNFGHGWLCPQVQRGSTASGRRIINRQTNFRRMQLNTKPLHQLYQPLTLYLPCQTLQGVGLFTELTWLAQI